MPDVQQFQCFVNTVGDFGFCQSLIARAIGHIFSHGIRKKLMFGMLHHITHMTAKLHKLLPRCGFGTCTGAVDVATGTLAMSILPDLAWPKRRAVESK